jgi:hypothetical protein
MKAILTVAALLFLAASLPARGPAMGKRQDKAGLTRKKLRHLRKVKRQALKFGKSDIIRVRSANHTQLEGLVTEVSNKGIQFTELPKEHGRRKNPWSRNLPEPRFIPFSQIQSIKAPLSERMSYFLLGLGSSLFGPIGWITDWTMITGRD